MNVEGNVPNINTDNGAALETTRNIKQGRVVYEEGVDTSKFTEKQKNQINFINTVAAVTGVEIHLFESKLDQNGMYDTPYNGKFDRGSNTLWIDVNAGKLGENIGDFALTRTLSHELTHFIRMNAPQEYMALMRFCFQKIGADKFNELVEGKAAKNENLDFEDAIEEVIASGCEMVLRDSKAIEQLARENRSLAQKILDFLEGFAEKVKKAFEGVNAVSEEAKLLESHAAELVELWDNALKTAAKNSASAGDTSAMGDTSTGNPTAETQQKVSNSQDGAAESQQETSEAEQEPETSKHKNIPDGARPKGRSLSDYLDEDGMFEEREYSYDSLVSKPDVRIAQLPDTSDIERNQYVEDTVLFGKNMIAIARKNRNAKNTETATYLYCEDLGANVLISRNSFKHGADRSMDRLYVSVCKALPEVLNNSIVINELKPRDNTTNGSYILLGIAERGGNLVAIRSIVNKKTWKLEDYNELYAIKKEDVGLMAPALPQKEGYVTSSTISISDLLRIVNRSKLANVVLSKDVINNLDSERGYDKKITPTLMYEDRTAELTDEQVIEQRLKNLKETDPEFKKLKKYSDISSKMVSNVKERNNLSRKLEKAQERLKDRVNVKADYRQTLEDYISELQKKLTRLQSEYDSMKAERQELYKDSQIEKIIEAERREMSQVAYDEYQRSVGEYRAARNKTETLGKVTQSWFQQFFCCNRGSISSSQYAHR